MHRTPRCPTTRTRAPRPEERLARGARGRETHDFRVPRTPSRATRAPSSGAASRRCSSPSAKAAWRPSRRWWTPAPTSTARSEFGWTALLVATQQPLLQDRRCICSITAPIRTSPTRAAGHRSISRPTTGTSKAATIPLASRTWTTSTTSSGCSRPMRTRTCACGRAPRRARCSRTSGCWKRAQRRSCAPRSPATSC